jgi:hypothetical protein
MHRGTSRARTTNGTLPDRRAARLLSRRSVGTPMARIEPSPSAIAALERVLEGHSAVALLNPDAVAENELRNAIRTIAKEASATDPIRCERMLLALRCAWRESLEVRCLAEQPIREALWTRIVRLSCEEFYGRRAHEALVT